MNTNIPEAHKYGKLLLQEAELLRDRKLMEAALQITEYMSAHSEPLPVLCIKIVLIAILLPLHHWLEHKVVSYLASKRLIIPDRKSIWNNLVKRKPVEH